MHTLIDHGHSLPPLELDLTGWHPVVDHIRKQIAQQREEESSVSLVRQESFWDREPTIRRIETPIARASDPMSSHLAANEMTASGRRGQQIAWAIAAVRAYPGRTSQELCEVTGIDRYTLARRLPDAVTAGAIRKGIQRACSVTGKTALTWWPVDMQAKAAA